MLDVCCNSHVYYLLHSVTVTSAAAFQPELIGPNALGGCSLEKVTGGRADTLGRSQPGTPVPSKVWHLKSSVYKTLCTQSQTKPKLNKKHAWLVACQFVTACPNLRHGPYHPCTHLSREGPRWVVCLLRSAPWWASWKLGGRGVGLLGGLPSPPWPPQLLVNSSPS